MIRLKKGQSYIAQEDCGITVVPQSILSGKAYKALVFAIIAEIHANTGLTRSFEEIHFFNMRQILPPPKMFVSNGKVAFLFETKPMKEWGAKENEYYYHKTIELWQDYNINLY